MKKFPKVLYVDLINEGKPDDEFFEGQKDIESHAQVGGNEIGIYELKETVIVNLKLEVKPVAHVDPIGKRGAKK